MKMLEGPASLGPGWRRSVTLHETFIFSRVNDEHLMLTIRDEDA